MFVRIGSTQLISVEGTVNLLCPAVNATHQTLNSFEAELLKEICGIKATHPAMAVDDDLGVRIEFVGALGQFT